jgi:transcriptional regulator with XRE-family HTH domain
MEAGMALINDIVRQAREQSQLTLEACAGFSDYSITQIHRYEQGECEVSFRYVSRLFAATGDRRLLACFSPGAAEILDQRLASARDDKRGEMQSATPSAQRTPPPGDPADLLRRELDALRQLTDAAQYVQQIVGDGLVDETDNIAIGQLLAKHDQVAAIMSACDRALIAYRNQSPERKRRGE